MHGLKVGIREQHNSVLTKGTTDGENVGKTTNKQPISNSQKSLYDLIIPDCD